MNLLLRLTQRRCLAAALLLLAAAAAALRWSAGACSSLEMWLHPPAQTSTTLAAALLQDSDARQSARLRGLHRAVTSELQAAAAEGFDVGKLQRLADAALALDTASYRSVAIDNLNKLRLSVPRKKYILRPAADGDANFEFSGSPRPKRAARRP